MHCISCYDGSCNGGAYYQEHKSIPVVMEQATKTINSVEEKWIIDILSIFVVNVQAPTLIAGANYSILFIHFINHCVFTFYQI
jgi:hypothetical protein